jgi:spore maturation protein SpmB
VGFGLYKKTEIYEHFIEGAKTGFTMAVMLIPYLVAMLFAIGLLRASGFFDVVLDGTKLALQGILPDTRFVDALPVAFMKPLSGSGARGMMLEAFNTYGVDSFVGRLASVMQGSTETTFYVLAVYFGAVGITRIRYALWAGLLCDAVGMTSAIFIAYWFFG